MTIEVVNHTGNGVSNTNFSKERYLSANRMKLEWERIWSRCRLFAGLESDVADPGDFFVFDLGREQVLDSIGRDGPQDGRPQRHGCLAGATHL